MLNILLSNSDLFDKLYQEINRQNTFYFWIIGIVVTVSIAIAAFFGILQWRLSDKQIEKLKSSVESKIVNDYHIDRIKDNFNELKPKLYENEPVTMNGWKIEEGGFKELRINDIFILKVDVIINYVDRSTILPSPFMVDGYGHSYDLNGEYPAYLVDRDRWVTVINHNGRWGFINDGIELGQSIRIQHTWIIPLKDRK
ncbi:hypothetical protein HUK49_09870 [Limosilactobacillus sp. c11Ua_112_M]|uniref:hypothetical protein n=1 Tax=Limosilactobacillus portuensis TaxID=2742601 RepID=UPI00177B2C06|nr:hypothetical protein [Limosilactobacillus portuensis]MBD8088202.1 hypothetical protein [Limosilactobacillus portuensis]